MKLKNVEFEQLFGNIMLVWADDGMESVIRSVDGVISVFKDYPTQYSVRYDRRYDLETLKDMIIYAILDVSKEK